MKRAIFVPLLVIGLLLTAGTTGCKRTPKGITPIPAAKSRPVTTPEPTRAGPITSAPPTTGPTAIGVQPGTGTPVKPDEGTTATKPAEPPHPTSPSGYPQPSPDLIEGMVADTNYFSAHAIHFEFDSALVRTTEYGHVHAVGDELKAKPENRLMIDGHCDERGTEEYNRALGERRALATREALIKYGVAPERISTRSWGEDRSVALGHDEDSWAKNRRAEFILLQPPK